MADVSARKCYPQHNSEIYGRCHRRSQRFDVGGKTGHVISRNLVKFGLLANLPPPSPNLRKIFIGIILRPKQYDPTLVRLRNVEMIDALILLAQSPHIRRYRAITRISFNADPIR